MIPSIPSGAGASGTPGGAPRAPRAAPRPAPRRGAGFHRRGRARRIRRATRVSAVVLGAALLVPPPPVAHATPWAAAPSLASSEALAKPRDPRAASARQQHDRGPVDVVLQRITPKTPGPRSKITISGEIVHKSRTTYQGVTVRLRSSPSPLAGRGGLQSYAEGAPGVGDPPNVAVSRAVSPNAFTPGTRRSWTLTTTAARLGLRGFGVYPIAIEVIDAAGRRLGQQRTVVTFVPRGRAGMPKPTKVAWIWPVIDRPRRSSDAVFLDDRLEVDFAPTGRLGGLVAAAGATRTPVTWAVDPAVLDDALAMARSGGYVLGPGQRRPKSAVAERWLRDLKAASNGEDLFTTPYADPDVVALVRAGMSKDLASANAEAAEVVKTEGLLSARLRPELTWPASGYVDRDTLDRLRAGGAREVLLNSAGVPPAAGAPALPTAVGTLDTAAGAVKTLAVDQALSRILGTATRKPGASVVAEQRFLAETAMIGLEAPRAARTVVVAPPRRWSPEPALARALLEDTASVPWLRAVPLRQVAQGKAKRRALVYPDAIKRYELDTRHLAQVRKLRTGVERFISTFEDPNDNILIRGIARTESSALRGRSRRARALRAEVEKAYDQETGKLRLRALPVSLAGASGPVPVTIQNDLPDKTVKVRLQVDPENTARLKIEPYASLTTIGPNQKETVKINMRLLTNAPTNVTLRLETPDGKRLRHSRQLQVRTTAVGKVTITITGVALGVLFLGIGIRVIRRSRHRKETEGTA